PSTPPPHPTSRLFPYTTLFRSHFVITISISVSGPRTDLRCACAVGSLSTISAASISCWQAASSPLVKDLCSLPATDTRRADRRRSEEHTSELQSRSELVCRLLL